MKRVFSSTSTAVAWLKKPRVIVAAATAIAIAMAAGMARVAAQQLQAGANVNVVGGPACSSDPANPFYKPDCPAKVFGDLTVQRQNEGSFDCSSRNSATCLAAGNDYRLVGVAGAQDGKVTGDSWMGIFWTKDGGGTWRSSLLPGWKSSDASFVDDSPAGQASPIKTLDATADATVRAGTSGLFYVSGIAFNRSGEANGAGVIGKTGVQFVSTYIDDNNSSNPNVPPRYLRTSIVDAGTSGQFLDKPWMAVDIPRGAASCSIPAGPGADGILGTADDVAAQTVPAGNVYVAYSTFLGSGNNPHTDIWFRSSSDCGATWSNATKLTSSIPLGQSAIIAIAPATGDIWVSWREFGLSGASDKIWAAKSTNAGKTFTKAAIVADLGVPSPQSTAYDAPTLPDINNSSLREARSNDYPALCVGSDGVARLAYAKRISQGPNAVIPQINFARILMTTSTDWTKAQPIDNHPNPGHQLQPTITCAGPNVTAAWYDQRNDNAFNLGAMMYVFYPFIIDPIPPPPVHTVDVRAARTTNGVFGPSIQVSHYPIVYDGTSFTLEKYNFLNLPLFGGGLLPFIGDYIDVLHKNKFVPPTGANPNWSLNDYANETPVGAVLWTDNRDVVSTDMLNSIGAIDFTNFGAPNTSACTANTLSFTRNQNLYAALVTGGLLAQVEGNARRTPNLQLRAYVVSMYNFTKPVAASANQKRFKLTFASGSGPASFGFDSQVNDLTVTVASYSGAAQSVFVPKSSAAAVIVQVTEVDAAGGAVANGLKARAIIAPDPSAPVEALDSETHGLLLTPVLFVDPQTGQSFSTINYQQPSVDTTAILNNLSPTIDFNNIDFNNIDFNNIDFNNIDFNNIDFNNIDFNNIDFNNIDFNNIDFNNIDFNNQPVVSSTLVTATNTGNVSAGYDLNALIQSLPASAVVQVIVSKLLTVPGTADCNFKNKVVLEPLTKAISSTGQVSASFSLPPGGVGVIRLRVACDPGDTSQACFDAGQNLSLTVQQQAPNCDTTHCDPLPGSQVIDHAPPILTLPSNISTPATSGAGATVAFQATARDFVDGSIAPVCSPASGSTFAIGTTTVNCSATDAHGNTANGSFTVTVTNAAPVANDQSVTLDEDQSAAIALTGSDVEGEPLTFTVLAGPSHGTLSGAGPNLTYTPAANYNGGDSFTFKVNDGADSNTATVAITVRPVNDPPSATGQAVATNEDTPVGIALTGSDVETPAGSLVFAIAAPPAHGSLSGALPNVAYTPAANYNGSDSFTFTVTDTGDGSAAALTSAPATVTIAIGAVNDAPVASNQSVAVNEDSSTAITLSATDVESDSLAYTIVAGPAHGTLSGAPPALSYAPAPNYFGADSFTFKANDGTVDSNVATVSITVTPVDDPPVANADTVATPVIAGQTVSIAVLANDTDIDDAASTLTVGAITTAPAHGTAVIAADGKSISYTAGASFAGSDSFQYTAKDPAGALSAPATVSMNDNLGFNGLFSPYQAPPKAYNLGSAVPIVWQYTNASGQVIDSSAQMPYLTFTLVSGANANTCTGGTETGTVLTNKDFPGNSNFQYFTATNTWQFNWQTVPPVTAGCWKVRVILDLNNSGIAGDAGDQVNGPFLVKLK